MASICALQHMQCATGIDLRHAPISFRRENLFR
jgi:hypothetical protein